MISKICLNKVASFNKPTVLETDRKVNLIYGLNGTGKSTLSNYLLNTTDSKYENCSIEGLMNDNEILVYNQNFIRENFFESESLKGIFTLSKKNKEAETKIANANKEIQRIELEKQNKEKDLQKEKKAIASKLERARTKVWEIKKKYTGGDRVFEFCLEGFKSDKNKLLNFVEGFNKPENKPTKTIDLIKREVLDLVGENAKKYEGLAPVTFPSQSIESENLFIKEIVGNENSTVSDLINKLGSSDWVKDGLEYLSSEIETENEVCPFCQESTISKQLFQSIKDYFDESYEADINSLKDYHGEYLESIQSIPDISIFENNPKYEVHKKDFELKYKAFLKVIEGNLKLIKNKLKSPSVSITLESSEYELIGVNDIVYKINEKIVDHNRKIDKKTGRKQMKCDTIEQ